MPCREELGSGRMLERRHALLGSTVFLGCCKVPGNYRLRCAVPAAWLLISKQETFEKRQNELPNRLDAWSTAGW